MIVSEVALTNFRSYLGEHVAFPPGLTVIVGANGAGKTNLLEAVHVGTQGTSLRTTRTDRVVRLGASAARVSTRGLRGSGAAFSTEVTINRSGLRRVSLNGAPLAAAEILRKELPVLAFTPDRLAVVKGGPAVRRIYLDRMIGRLLPSRAELPGDYGRALAQRNAALRRVRLGISSRPALMPWNDALIRLGTELETTRATAISTLDSRFSAVGSLLGLLDATAEYSASGLSDEELQKGLGRDIERGATGTGPHLQDVAIRTAGRDLRAYGSQGEQRVAVLALLLAEALALAELRGEPPVLLLDDVMSELDDRRCASLLANLPEGSQALVTATSLHALPGEIDPALVLEVTPGKVSSR